MKFHSGVAFSTIFAVFLLIGPNSSFAQSSFDDKCANVCDCNNFMCTDFCSISSCGHTQSQCRKRYDQMVRECNKACQACQRLRRQKR